MKELFKKNKKSISMFLILIVIFLIFGVLSGFINLTARNVTNIIIQNAYVIILAIGMTLVVITGNIDMSVGSVCGFTGATAAILYNTGIGLLPTIVITVLLGLVTGSIIGFFTAYKAVPAFIVTLAGMQVFRGLTYAITNMSPIGFYDDKFGKISAGFVQDYIPGDSNISVIIIMLAIFIVYVLIDQKGIKKKAEKGIPVESKSYHVNKYIAFLVADLILTWVFFTYRGIPNVFVIIAVLALIMTYVLNNTVFGRHVYAIGGNKEAAELSGIDAKKTLFKVYI
ncbi:MAG: sugar ABC transporter permease, partial [Bacilli bacterium]